MKGIRAATCLSVGLAASWLFAASAVSGQDPPSQAPAFTSALATETFDSAWTWIARSHYDSSFNGLDWDAVRDELRPSATNAASMNELRETIAGMLERIGESHYVLIPREIADAIEPGDDTQPTSAVPGDVGIQVRLIGDDLVVWRIEQDSPAAQAGIRTGWVIEEIDGRSASTGVAALQDLAEMDRRRALTRFLMASAGRLEGPPGSSVEVAFRDGYGEPVQRTLLRHATPGDPIRLGNLPTLLANMGWARRPLGDDCVGVIHWNVWMVPLMARIDSAVHELRSCRGIVLDLRGNPGGVAGMLMGVAGHFFEQSEPLATLRTRSGEIRFPANPRRVAPDGTPVEPFAGPVAIIVDILSVSTSEMFAGGMQSVGRARVFGQPSSGQALPAVASRLPNNDVLMYVLADATTPDGQRIEGAGVVPDEIVPLTREDLLAGRDAPLDAAIRWITTSGRD